MDRTQWLLGIAHSVSLASKDQSTRVGCVIVDDSYRVRSIGYNGFPAGFAYDDDPEWSERPTKYAITLHAEENAIITAARLGIPIEGCTLYCTHPPCSRCARMIAQAGIVHVVYQGHYEEQDFMDRWAEDLDMAYEILAGCSVSIEEVWDGSV